MFDQSLHLQARWHHKPNSLKLSFSNIEAFVWILLIVNRQSNSPDILVLCETNLDDSIDSGNFSLRGYLSLIWKDSSAHMHHLAVYVKEGLPFAWDLSRKLCRFLFKFSTGFTSLSILLLFPLSITFISFVHSFFILFHLT